MEAIMDKRLTGLIIAAAVPMVSIACATAAGAQADEVFPVPLGAFVNRDVPPYSETDFRLRDHQQLKGHFFDGSRDRPR
jgi:hypothetical protein